MIAPRVQQRLSPADLWEQKVDEGMSEEEATEFVRRAMQDSSTPDFSDVESGSASAALTPNMQRLQRQLGGKRKVSMPRGILNAALQGASFGFMDEIAGAMAPPGLRQGVRDNIREDVKSFRETNPKTAFASEVAGGIAVPTGGAFKAASQLPKVGRVLGSAAGAGAVTGGIYGIGTGEDAGERLQHGLVGAGVGAATGAVAGAAAERLGRSQTMRRLAHAFSRNKKYTGQGATGPVNTKSGGVRGAAALDDYRETPRERAIRYIDDALRKDTKGKGITDIAREMEKMAPDDPRLLLNMGGLNTGRSARVAQTIRSEATEDIPRAIYTQLDEAPERAIGEMERAIGKPIPNKFERLAELQEQATKDAQPLYDRIRNVFVKSETLDRVMNRPAIREAVDIARTNLLNKGEGIPDGITVGLADDVKKVLDAEIESIEDAIAAGMARGKDKSRLVGLQSAKDALIKELDELTGGEYAKARGVAETGLRSRQAFREGTQFSRTRTPQVEHLQGQRSPAEREAFLEGAVADMADVVSSTKDRRSVAARLFGSDAERNKLRAAVQDNPSALRILENMFTRERDLRRQATEALVPGQSMTSVNARDVAEFAPTMDASHPPVTKYRLIAAVGDWAGEKLTRAYREKIQKLNTDAANELGRLLTLRSSDKTSLARLIEEAEEAALKRASRQATRLVGAKAGGVAAGASTPRMK